MAGNLPRKDESFDDQKVTDEVCKLFNSLMKPAVASTMESELVSGSVTPPVVSEAHLPCEETIKHKRRRRRRKPKPTKYSSSDDEAVSDESLGALMDLLIWFNKQEPVRNSAPSSGAQADSSSHLQDSKLGQNTTEENGAVPKKAAKPRRRSKQVQSGEGDKTAQQDVDTPKQESKKSRTRNKENLKTPQLIADKIEGHLDGAKEHSPHSAVPDTEATTNKFSSTKKTKRKPKASQSKNSNKDEFTFKNYLLEEELRVERENGGLIEGILRINQKNFKEAYVHSPDKGPDILIDGIQNRNRALEGDEVIVRLKPSDEWRMQGSDVQKSAEVVFIKSENHPRTAVGTLRQMADKNPNFALFSPRDSRVPRIRIPMSMCPPDFPRRSTSYSEVLFMAKISSWFDVRYAIGELTKCLGNVGDKAAETASILVENEIDISPYPDSFKQFYPQTFIIEEELSKRLDIRKECIFTIDPLTARDLDDAVSCKKLENGNYEIGVHISDVTYFLAEGTPLDEEVSKRATTTYLVDEVYHMLPRELCMLCSLLPGNDRIAFSVFWELDAEAQVVSHRFARTIINSCVQLAYEHVQEMIERPEKVWVREELPHIHGGFSPSDLVATVQVLHRLALKLRSKRFSNGALRIDQTKLMFHLHPTVGLPIAFSQYINKESHRMIEEFMLLANITVATHLKERYPDICFLRSHAEPHKHMMKELQATMGSVGIHLDVSSAGSLQASLGQYCGSDMYSQARMMVLNCVCAKPMARAKYFCGSLVYREQDYWHYALSVPLYTHFTSPIRRYADVMVHRLLAASLGYIDKPDWIPDKVLKIAVNCNKQKFNAKRAGEQSSDLFLAMYVAQFGPLVEDAVVLDVKDYSFDVILLSMGYNVRIYTNNMPDLDSVFKPEGKVSMLELHWQPSSAVPVSSVQIVQMFSIVKVVVSCSKTSLRIEAHLLRPELASP